MSNLKKNRVIPFVISTCALLIAVLTQVYLSQLTSYDSESWLKIKNPASIVVILISLVGLITSILTIAAATSKPHKCISILYVVLFIVVFLSSIVTIAVSGIGFLG